jgi:hypothetical protein
MLIGPLLPVDFLLNDDYRANGQTPLINGGFTTR